MPFPLSHRVPSWHRPRHPRPTGGKYFGAPRKPDRDHAGCDLISTDGSPVYAIDDGIVFEITRNFYKLKDTHRPYIGAIAILHRTGFVARYCEVPTASITVRKGATVTAGQMIGKVGKLNEQAMLHFELYSGLSDAPMSTRAGRFQRRWDIIDPSRLLDLLYRHIMNNNHGPLYLPGQGLAQNVA
jgi:murein DD-endopeptidase MepM/ murein hydrolase activator NlpD